MFALRAALAWGGSRACWGGGGGRGEGAVHTLSNSVERLGLPAGRGPLQLAKLVLAPRALLV